MTERLAIEYVSPASLQTYERNARTHTDEQIKQLADWIAEVGFLVPCLVDDCGVLVAGHGRRAAALLLGLKEIPVIRAAGLTPAQIRAHRLADNQIALASSYDLDALAAEVKALGLDDFDLTKLGFSDAYLEALLADNETALQEAQRAEDVAQMRGPPPKEPEAGGTGGDPGEDRYKSQFGVIVICANEAEQKQVYERLKGDGLSCRVVVT